MLIKNKFSMLPAIIFTIVIFCVTSPSVFACDSDPCETALDESQFTGMLKVDNYTRCPMIHVLAHPCCSGCKEALECIGVDLESEKWELTEDDDFGMKRSPVGQYTLYFVGNTAKDYFYTNSLLIKALLQDKLIPRIDGFQADPTP